MRALLGTLALALALAGVGALDTEAAEWGPRLGYWLVMTGVAAGGCYLARLGVRRFVPTWPEAAVGAASAALAAGPLTVTALAICIGLFGGEFSIDRLNSLIPGVFTIVALLQAGLAVSYWQPAVPVKVTRSGLEARLPLELSGAIVYAVQAEDHYVRVHTDRGATLLRMQLAEAVTLFAEQEGRRVHRSWWVRGTAVAFVKRCRRGAVITLVNGQEVPVSRSAATELGEALARWRLGAGISASAE